MSRDQNGPKRDRNLSPDRPFAWSARSEQAALLVAEDRLTNEKIAEAVGVTRRTIDSWKTHNEFAARVDGHVAAFAETIRKHGIGRLENRVRRLNEHWSGLRDVIAARAADALRQQAALDEHVRKSRALGASEAQIARQLAEMPAVAPGMETGMVVRVETYSKTGLTVEYKVDTAPLAEMRAMEQQAAKELGQWVDRKETEVGSNALAVLRAHLSETEEDGAQGADYGDTQEPGAGEAAVALGSP